MCEDKKLSRIPYVRILNIDSIECIAKSTKSDRMHSQTQSHYQSVYLEIKGEHVKVDMIEADLKALVQWKIAESNEPQNNSQHRDDDDDSLIDSEDDNNTSKTVNKKKKFKPSVVVSDKISEKLLSAREGLSMCKLCDSVFVGSSSKLSLHRHITANHGRTFTFKNRKLGEGMYKAKSINYSNKRKSNDSLETPTKSNNTQNYICSFCDRCFDNSYSRDIHVRALHSSIEKSPSSKTKSTSSSFWPTVEKSSSFVCPTCGAKFYKKSMLMGHMTKAHKSFQVEGSANASESFTGHWLNAVSHSSSRETIHHEEEEKYDSVTYNRRKSSDIPYERKKMDDSPVEKQDDSPQRNLKLDDTPPRKKVKLGQNRAKKISSVSKTYKGMSTVNLNNSKVLACELCSCVYSGSVAKYRLKYHMKKKHQNKKVSDEESKVKKISSIRKTNIGISTVNLNSIVVTCKLCSRVYYGKMAQYSLKRHMDLNHQNKKVSDEESNHEHKDITTKNNHENKNSVDLKSNNENKTVTDQASNQVKSDVGASSASSNVDIYSKYAWKCTSCNLPFTSSRGLHIHKAKSNCNSTSLMYYVHTEHNVNRNVDDNINKASSSFCDKTNDITEEKISKTETSDTKTSSMCDSRKSIEKTGTAVSPKSKSKSKMQNRKCPRCGKIFSSMANRMRHMETVNCQTKTEDSKKELMQQTKEDAGNDNGLQVVSAEEVFVRLERLPEPLNVKEYLTKYLAKVKSMEGENLQSDSECLTEKTQLNQDSRDKSNASINHQLDNSAVSKDLTETSQHDQCEDDADVPAKYPVMDNITKPVKKSKSLTKKLASAKSSRSVATKVLSTQRSASALMESLSAQSSSSAKSSIGLETELLSAPGSEYESTQSMISQDSGRDVEESDSSTNVVTESNSQCLISAVNEALHSPRKGGALKESSSTQSSASALMESLSAERSTCAVTEALHTQRSASALMESLSAQMSSSAGSEFMAGLRSVSVESSESADTTEPMSAKSSVSKIHQLESTCTESSNQPAMNAVKDSTSAGLSGMEFEQNNDSESNEVEPVDSVLRSSKSSKDIAPFSNSYIGENNVHSTTTFPEQDDTTVSSTTTHSSSQNNNAEVEKENVTEKEMEEVDSGLESSGNVSATFSSSLADTTSSSVCVGSESSTSVNGVGMTALTGSVCL